MYEYTTYKGNKILVLKKKADDSYPFSFGRSKAKLIIENIEIIKTFAAEEGQETL